MLHDREKKQIPRADTPHVQRAVEGPSIRATIPAVRSVAAQDLSRVPAHATPLFSSARAEPSAPLDPRVRGRIEDASGADLHDVRVHSGSASATAAHVLGARAFTVGSDIYLGKSAHALPSAERERLLTHEAVHTVQQGGRSAAVTPSTRVSSPDDASEREAHGFSSRSLALRDRLRDEPHVQRDLTGTHAVKDGTWELDLKTISAPGGKNGMSGTIKFTPDAAAPDSTRIKLVQSVRDEDLTTGAEYVWTGDEADRNSMQTTANATTGVTGGFFIDHSAAMADPRTKKTDPRVSPYYRTYWPNATSSQDGSKSGTTIRHASLWDFPGSGGNRRFTFETVAKGTDTGYYYASLSWGFTISDASKGKVEHEHASARRGPTATFRSALREFNKFYKNPGSSTAP